MKIDTSKITCPKCSAYGGVVNEEGKSLYDIDLISFMQCIKCDSELPDFQDHALSFLYQEREILQKRVQELEAKNERLKSPNIDDICNNCKKEYGFHRADDNKCPISEGESYGFDLSTTYFNPSCKG